MIKIIGFLNWFVLQWLTVRLVAHFDDAGTRIIGYGMMLNVAPLSGWDDKPYRKAFFMDSWNYRAPK